MAFQEGLADNHYHLLQLFTTFVTTHPDLMAVGQNWQLLKSQDIPAYNLAVQAANPVYTENFSIRYFRAPGFANQDSIHINILCYEAATTQIFNWYIAGATGYEENELFEKQPNICRTYQLLTSPETPVLTLINSQIKYWFVANGRRAIVIAKIGGDFFVTYMGFILAYGKPSEYPYPLLIAGNHYQINNGYTFTSLYNFWNLYGNNGNGMLYLGNSQWLTIGNSNSGGSSGRINGAVAPYEALRSLTEAGNLRGNLDGSFTILPLIIYSAQSGYIGEYGELQGVYYIPGVGNTDVTTEDTLTIGSDTYLICQNVDKNTRNDFAAILLK